MKRILTLCLCMGLHWFLHAQETVKGTVLNQHKMAVSGALISDLSKNTLALTDSAGKFTFQIKDSSLKSIIITHTSYLSDTQVLKSPYIFSVVLKPVLMMQGVKLQADNERNSQLAGHAIRTEQIGQGELKKAACCDLAGCFETQGTVQPMTTNVLTNSKELRILGLSGVYNQVLVDGLPMILGLGYTYGISSIPGTLVDNIFVSKGSTSVLQGFEGMVGQINVIPKSPDKGERFLLNMYVNSFGESQYNLNYRFGKGKWSNLVALHVVQPAMKWDRDKDSFLDLPLMKRYLFYDKIKYGDENKKGLISQIGLKIFKEERSGGQMAYDPKKDTGSLQVYGQKIDFYQGEMYSKTAYRFNDNNKLALMLSGVHHDQRSWFGPVSYNAKQWQAYSNLQFERTWNHHHELKTGLSYRFLEINEKIRITDTSLHRGYAGNYLKSEKIPGLFAENTFKWRGDIVTLITGIRADYHNRFGWQFTPRAMVKYDVTEKAILRASAGSGWRTVNLFSENIGLLVSSRDIVFMQELKPEKSINWGINFLQKFKFKKLEGFFTVDFYQTRFSNQFFPDYDSDPHKAFISNYTGNSVSNGFQTDWNIKYNKIWEIKMAYNFLDVYRNYRGVKYVLPFNARHKLLGSVSYLSPGKKWRADVYAHWFGEQRLPDTEMNPEAFRQAKTSRPYTTFNIQVTRTWRKLEFYAGCENLFDYRQLRPIVSWQDPFSPYFDTSFNWGPTRGREIYLGFRWKLF